MRPITMKGPLTPAERAEALKQFRLAAGLTQREVGTHFGVDKGTVSAWETARSSPLPDKLVPLDELYGANGELLAMYGFSSLAAVETLKDRVAKLEKRADAAERQDHLHAEEIAAILDFVGFVKPDAPDGTPDHAEQS